MAAGARGGKRAVAVGADASGRAGKEAGGTRCLEGGAGGAEEKER